MHIAFNTEDLTEHDRAVLAFIASGETDPYAASLATKPALTNEDPNPPSVSNPTAKPAKRVRRTNAEIAFDTAKEAYDDNDSAENFVVLRKAAQELEAKDPENDRLKNLPTGDGLSEFEPAQENEEPSGIEAAAQEAEEIAAERAAKITPEQAKELASELITNHRADAIEILKALGVRKFSELSEDQLPEFAKRAHEVFIAAKAKQ